MDYIIDFYKNLDSLNIIIFWGVIIVITLLLIFSIIMVNKNRKLKSIIENNHKDKKEIEQKSNQPKHDIPIKKIENTDIIENNNNKENFEPKTTKSTPITEEEKFIAEEYIINYKSNIENKEANHDKRNNNNTPQNNSINDEKKELIIPNKPYQRNILREMSLNQTSPIGIIKRENEKEIYKKEAEELHTILNSEKETLNNQNTYANERKEQLTEIHKEEKNDNQINQKSFNEIVHKSNDENKEYLKEVSQKLSNAVNDIERTEYEIKQEEEAIISYEELMQKKDSIKTIDEEEAVISIEELYQKEKNKLYGITEEEGNDKFIDELKNLRGDL